MRLCGNGKRGGFGGGLEGEPDCCSAHGVQAIRDEDVNVRPRRWVSAVRKPTRKGIPSLGKFLHCAAKRIFR